MKRSLKNASLLLACSAFLTACGDSAEKNSADGVTTQAEAKDANEEMPAASSEQTDDANLVSELVQSMYGGIALMKQGQQKATAQPVKDLAKKLETEHTKLTDELKALGAKKGWTLPSAESDADMKKREDMADDEVDAYQKEWLSLLKDRHETNIGKLERHKTTDPDLQAASAKGLPKLKELLADIERVQQSMK